MLRPSAVLRKASASSRRWLARQFADPYVKARAQYPSHYRSRAAFKLLEIDDGFHIFGGDVSDGKGGKVWKKNEDVNVVIDLGAAPGGWSQVVAGKLGLVSDVDEAKRAALKGRPDSEDRLWSSLIPQRTYAFPVDTSKKIIAVDILPMSPVSGVTTLRTDFLSPSAADLIAALLPPGCDKADVVLSDIAMNKSGNPLRDSAQSLEVMYSVYRFAKTHLRAQDPSSGMKGGTMVLKYFDNVDSQAFRSEVLDKTFTSVKRSKPHASRTESAEAYLVCRGFRGGMGNLASRLQRKRAT